MSILGRALQPVAERRVTDWAEWVAGDDVASSMDRERALRLSAVWRCVHLIAETIGGFPIRVYGRSGGSRRPLAQQPKILTDPSGSVPASQWRSSAVLSLLLHGNAWGYVVESTGNWPSRIELLDPTRVTVTERPGTTPAIAYDGVPLDPVSVWHLPGIPLPGSSVGMSPLAAAAQSLGLAREASEMATDYYARGGHPTSLLVSEATLSQEQATTAKARFKAATRSDHLAVLGGGWRYEAVQADPADALFLDTIRATDIDVCRFFGVPPEMIGAAAEGSSVTYANREQRALDFLTFTVLPWVTRIEQALTDVLPRGQVVKASVDGLLRTDPETQSRIFDRRLANGTITVDEVRALMDEPPMEADNDEDR